MSQQNLEIIGQVYRAFETRDFGVVPRLFDPDIEIRQTDELPWGGRYLGHDGAIAFFRKLLAVVDGQAVSEYMFPAGDRVVQVGRTKGVTVDGRVPYDVAEVHVWQLRGDKIVAFEAYIDTPAMLTTLGS
ncbi:nuclear transport factor 2 family protein [Nocardia mexicana]|uniref:SnoaL-like domain-containing protein n=1 Tax=Nocardia mexicana TaxID=279262 RepID=A0A370HF11_9NOCA|nr:nuclear transport factor 2 family protein [Nocardia mexicana]RDI55622.1 hypothetical protein DFR68_101456 [Nocardia mexicana]